MVPSTVGVTSFLPLFFFLAISTHCCTSLMPMPLDMAVNAAWYD